MIHPVLTLYQRIARACALALFAGAACLLPAAALVPGPILLQDDTLEAMQAAERRLTLPATRAKATCLRVAGQRFCPGMAWEDAQQQRASLPPAMRLRVLLFASEAAGAAQQLKGVLAFLPLELHLPPPNFESEPLQLGPEPLAMSELDVTWADALLPQPLGSMMQWGEALQNPQDYSLRYDAQRQLGLVLQHTEAGHFVIGAFVAQ